MASPNKFSASSKKAVASTQDSSDNSVVTPLPKSVSSQPLTIDLSGTLNSNNVRVLDDPRLIELETFLSVLEETLSASEESSRMLDSFASAYAKILLGLKLSGAKPASKLHISSRYDNEKKELKFTFEIET